MRAWRAKLSGIGLLAVVAAGITRPQVPAAAGEGLERDPSSAMQRSEDGIRLGLSRSTAEPAQTAGDEWCIVRSADAGFVAEVNRFTASVRWLQPAGGAARTFVAVREPVAAAFGLGGRMLVVANLLPASRPQLDDDLAQIAAEVTLIEPDAATAITHVALPDGSHSARGLAVSPDGRFAVVTHIVANYHQPAWSADRGGINRNALSVISLEERARWLTLGLDDEHRGAANPWAVAFDPAGGRLVVAHAGTHELTVLAWPPLLEAARRTRGADERNRPAATPGEWRAFGRRLAVPVRGPRTVVIDGDEAIVRGHFDGAVAAVSLSRADSAPRLLRVGRWPPADEARLGEFHFHDAPGAGWQSCASCHPDGRDDTLNWDLPNDGIGNPKNTKSLLLAPFTPPAMWRGVRGNARDAIRAGMRHMLGEPEDLAREAAIEAYLRSLRPVSIATAVASDDPAEAERGPSETARRGRALFHGRAGCVQCHPPPWYTAMRAVDPGGGVAYDIPTLVEVWRTAPYLHDGSAPTLRVAIRDFNPLQRRGRTAELTEQELDDLVEFVRSL
ncbi:MAG: hypothetical protein N2652_09650 [Kiritimatiellae bacterium]|nr:hypothetical protein [Kiritimatiellia bacterium]